MGHVPRPPTEQLVAAARGRFGERPARVVDVGTGSGALAIAISAAAPPAPVWATDTSRCAVALARANVRRHGLGDRIIVRHGDLLEPVPRLAGLRVALASEAPTSVYARRASLVAGAAA